MDKIQEISSEICKIFEAKIDSLTDEQAEVLNLHNKSMNFYVELGDKQKSLWNAQETLKYLKQITK
tara:strand:+ start:611 stop:808 length:198 start_codon:yes stop_codon:yes gene_type:complete